MICALRGTLSFLSLNVRGYSASLALGSRLEGGIGGEGGDFGARNSFQFLSSKGGLERLCLALPKTQVVDWLLWHGKH